MADKKIKGEQNRFIPGTNIERHREWRGLKDTWYDYTQWIKLLGIMMKFASIAPTRIVRGLFEYRWFGSFLAAFNMRDRCVEGLRGPARSSSGPAPRLRGPTRSSSGLAQRLRGPTRSSGALRAR